MPVDTEYRSWHGTLDSQMKISENGIGSTIDMKNDLGFSDSSIHSGRITLGETNSYQLTRLEFAKMHYAGDTIISRELQYNGRQYAVGSRVYQLARGRVWPDRHCSPAESEFFFASIFNI